MAIGLEIEVDGLGHAGHAFLCPIQKAAWTCNTSWAAFEENIIK